MRKYICRCCAISRTRRGGLFGVCPDAEPQSVIGELAWCEKSGRGGIRGTIAPGSVERMQFACEF
jgi:hypothetical protein